LTIIVGVLLLPALLIATWIGTWFIRRSRRWLYYFPAGLAAVLLVAAVTFLAPRAPCESSTPMACVDDVSLFGTANLLTGFWTWLILLAVTALIEVARHLAYIWRLRRTTDEPVEHQSR
jgi:zinc transporter ZupT